MERSLQSAPTPTPRSRQLEDLVDRAATGDQAAFARLYDATCVRVYGMVLRTVGDPAQAEEVTQEVFMKVWQSAGRFESDKGTALSWLLTIAHHNGVDRVRSSEAIRRRDALDHHTNRHLDHDQTLETVQATFEARQVRQALGRLSREQREVLVLVYFGHRTHVEAARALGVPEGTAKTRVRDGLIKLRRLLSAQD